MDIIGLTADQIGRESLSPDDAGCQDVLAAEAAAAGFDVERMNFGAGEQYTSNMWAKHTFSEHGPHFVFAGHTDVVPANPADWDYPPFELTTEGGFHYGRGTADMKGANVAFLAAAARFIREHGNDAIGSVSMLITSDEEDNRTYGTKAAIAELAARGEQVDMVVVGEATSDAVFGDTIKNGRKGSEHVQVTLHGRSGHLAYPDRPHDDGVTPHNAGWYAARLHDAMFSETNWDVDQAALTFGPDGRTVFGGHLIQADGGKTNVIPDTAEVHYNWRTNPNPNTTPEVLRARLEREIKTAYLETGGREDATIEDMATIEWETQGAAYYTEPTAGVLSIARNAITRTLDIEPALSTTGGGSDGGFYVAGFGAEVAEFGVVNRNIHGPNERVAEGELEQLSDVYFAMLEEALLPRD